MDPGFNPIMAPDSLSPWVNLVPSLGLDLDEHWCPLFVNIYSVVWRIIPRAPDKPHRLSMWSLSHPSGATVFLSRPLVTWKALGLPGFLKWITQIATLIFQMDLMEFPLAQIDPGIRLVSSPSGTCVPPFTVSLTVTVKGHLTRHPWLKFGDVRLSLGGHRSREVTCWVFPTPQNLN